jgi:hypothetical protein
MDQGLESQGRQVRSVFERRIGRPRPGVEDRVLAGIQYERQPGFPGRLGWLAIPLAIALALLVVAGLLSTRDRVGNRPLPATSAHPSAAPVATDHPQPVKGTVSPPAFYFIRADQPDILYGQSWGRDVVEVTPPVSLPKNSTRYFAHVSPDGSRFLIGTTVYDQSGMQLGSLTIDKAVVWADDSRHLCWMAPPAGFAGDQGGPGRLMTWQPGEAPREVATLGRFSGQSTASVRACSPAADRVVVAQNNVNRVGEVWVVKLSSGAVVMHETYPADQMMSVVASPSGQFIAESNFTTGSSVVRDTTTGNTMALPGRAVLAFSWDGSLAIVFSPPLVEPSAPPQPAQAIFEVRDLRAARTIWTAPAPAPAPAPAARGLYSSLSALSEPGGTRMLVERSADGAAGEIWLVQPDGRAFQIATNAYLIR